MNAMCCVDVLMTMCLEGVCDENAIRELSLFATLSLR